MKKFLLCIFSLLVAAPAYATDVAATKTNGNFGCSTYTLCSGQSATGQCKDSSGNNIVAQLNGTYGHSFRADTSTATTYSCNILESSNGYQATKRAAITSSSVNPPTDLTDARVESKFDGVLDQVWAECSTITGGTITLTVLACPLSR